MTGARAAAALLAAIAVVACGGNAGSAATPKPKPVRLAEPGALALAPDGALLVADRRLHRVVRIDVRTKRRRVVATGLRDIVELSYDDMGRLYVCAASRIYRIDGTGKVVVAGTGRREHTGDGGPATAASLSGPGGFEVDHDERIVIAEYDNWIRAVEPDGTIGTIAGTGAEGYAGDGGPAREAIVRHPHDIALRRDREVVIADSHNGALRLVDATGTMRTLATGVFPIGLAVDEQRNVYVSEFQGRVLRISPTGRRTVLVPRAR